MPKSDLPPLSDSHFVSLPSTGEAERVQNYNPTQCPFFPDLWIKMLPSFSHSVYSLIHLPPSCWANMFVLNLPPLHNLSFSLPLWIIYLHTTPPPPSIAQAPFFSPRSLLHLSSSPLHIHHWLRPFSPSTHFDVSHINFPILLIQQIKFCPSPLPSLQYCGKQEGEKNQQIQTDKSIIR